MEISRRSLPENAYRKLAPGEEYAPLVGASEQVPEMTPRSLIMGLVMAAVFSAAAAFLGTPGTDTIEGAYAAIESNLGGGVATVFAVTTGLRYGMT